MTLITALPFSIIILLFVVSLVKALAIDNDYYKRDFQVTPWSGLFWKERLKQIISYDDQKSVNEFIENTVKPAFKELQQEFVNNGIEATVHFFRKTQKRRD